MMKYYKDEGGQVFGYEAWQVKKIGLTEMSEAEMDFHINPEISKDQLLYRLSFDRKEQERQGVTVNSTRYAGDPGNRQALQEAIAFMEDVGLTEFPSWKDSDNCFHADHPLVDVV